MCGIFGILSTGAPPPKPCIVAALGALANRGPDDEGTFQSGDITLGHTRLSILDTSSAGHQPMLDRTGRYVITFNGEIYNYKELKAELEAAGYKFRTSTDTEVLLNGYIHWGAKCLQRLNGMFAFAIWDRKLHALFIAKDRLGKKPLFYATLADGSFIFASTISTIFKLAPQLNYIRDPQGLYQYLSLGYTIAPVTIAKGVSKLPPAHFITTSTDRKISIIQYWTPESGLSGANISSTKNWLIDEFRELFLDSVRLRLRSDVPLGAFLSSGLDSASIVWAMREILGKDGNFRAFGAGFCEDSYDETERSGQNARMLGVAHESTVVTSDIVHQLAQIAAVCGEPVADSSILPMYSLSKFAKQSVTVVLSGDGADELFYGYQTYVATSIASKLPTRLSRLIKSEISPLYSRFFRRSLGKVALDQKLSRFFANCELQPLAAHLRWREIFSSPELTLLLSSDFSSKESANFNHDLQQRLELLPTSLSLIEKAATLDRTAWLSESILTKVDRATMAHGLEARAPFLDYRLVEFATTLPLRLNYSWRISKPFLRSAFDGLIPNKIVRGKKCGFNPPLPNWLFNNKAWIESASLYIEQLGTEFDKTYAQQLLRLHGERKVDASFKLFALMMLSAWENSLNVT